MTCTSPGVGSLVLPSLVSISVMKPLLEPLCSRNDSRQSSNFDVTEFEETTSLNCIRVVESLDQLFGFSAAQGEDRKLHARTYGRLDSEQLEQVMLVTEPSRDKVCMRESGMGITTMYRFVLW